jgi:uncharacterized protein YbjT (DUF2867 family)
MATSGANTAGGGTLRAGKHPLGPRRIADARAACVERLVLLSNAAAPSGDTSNAVTRYHIESEAAVRESGLDWTFLRPRTSCSADSCAAAMPAVSGYGSVRARSLLL